MPNPNPRSAAAAAAEKKEAGDAVGIPPSQSQSGQCVMLDAILVLVQPVKAQPAPGTRTAKSRTSLGSSFSVSLQLAAPPDPSYILLRCPEASALDHRERDFHGLWSAAAADANLILLRIDIPVKRDGFYKYPNDLFVYKADKGTPTLTLLPPIPDGCFQPWAGETGVVARGANAVAVASLRVILRDNDHEVAKLSRIYLSASSDGGGSDHKWEEMKVLAMPYDAEQVLGPFQWIPDTVFSHAGNMFWVDENVGFIFCDVFDDSPELRLVKFPVGVRKVLRNQDSTPTKPFRKLGVSGGIIKYVYIDAYEGQGSATVIRTWILRFPEMVWEEDSVVSVNHLWDTSFKTLGLPLLEPRYPVLSMVDPHTVHFLLSEPCPKFDDPTRVVTINMRKKSVEYCRSYKMTDPYQKLFFKGNCLSSDLSGLPVKHIQG